MRGQRGRKGRKRRGQIKPKRLGGQRRQRGQKRQRGQAGKTKGVDAHANVQTYVTHYNP